ncbi:MAG: ATP-binding cassette domain-containing protein [Oligoflexales bacterium]|nr:ATP-binding cassette domain-containing protein [Oligoflexales bacterium]
MIHLKDIHVFFNRGTQLENHVLKGLNLLVQEGEFLVVIGGNGAGKSTLMNVVAGDVLVDQGQVFVGGSDLTGKATVKRSGKIARIFQDPMIGTFSHLTIEENLSLSMKRGERRGFAQALKRSSLELFREKLRFLGMGLENRLKDQVCLLSGGQRQALSLVMATMHNADVLLLDEHTAALDPKTARIILEISQKILLECHLTTIMITHSMSQALEFGDRTIFMQQGVIVKDLSQNERKGLLPQDLVEFFS